MRKHHAFRIAGAAGSVLDERGGIGAGGMRQIDRRRRGLEVRNAFDSVQGLNLGAEEARKPPPLRHRDQYAAAGVAQDGGLAAEMILKLREPHWRIDRHWNSAGIKDPEESDEKIDAGRQH